MRHTQQTTSRLTTNLINSEQPSSAGDETPYQRSLCYDGIMYVCHVLWCEYVCADLCTRIQISSSHTYIHLYAHRVLLVQTNTYTVLQQYSIVQYTGIREILLKYS